MFDDIRDRLEKAAGGNGSQRDESLRALANDVGQIINPSLAIAASVASDLLKSRSAIARLLKAVDLMKAELDSLYSFFELNDKRSEMEAKLKELSEGK